MGRSPNPYVKDRAGKPIAGLSQNKSDGRYYATHSRPRKWFGKDFDRAVTRFRTWKHSQGAPNNSLQIEAPTTELTDDKLANVVFPPTGEQTVQRGSAEYWACVAEDIRADPVLAGQYTGLPLDRLHELKPMEPSLALNHIGDKYLNKQPALQWQYKDHVTKWWNEFKRITGKSTVRDLTEDDFNTYRDTIYTNGKDNSSRYVNNRFTAVVSVFKFNMTEGKDIASLRLALDCCKALRRLKRSKYKPTPIPVSDFHALLAGCDTLEKRARAKLAELTGNSKRLNLDTKRAQVSIADALKWRAILLTALNMAAYPVDVCNLETGDIDLKAKTLCNLRTKTGIPRLAVLWNRTVAAIKAYQECAKPAGKFVFPSRTGKQFTSHGFIKGYKRVRKAAGVTVEFASIRDGSQTAAIQGGADPLHADILLGHKVGIKDNYLLRNPLMVADACEAIEAHYFPPAKRKAKSPEISEAEKGV